MEDTIKNMEESLSFHEIKNFKRKGSIKTHRSNNPYSSLKYPSRKESLSESGNSWI